MSDYDKTRKWDEEMVKMKDMMKENGMNERQMEDENCFVGAIQAVQKENAAWEK